MQINPIRQCSQFCPDPEMRSDSRNSSKLICGLAGVRELLCGMTFPLELLCGMTFPHPSRLELLLLNISSRLQHFKKKSYKPLCFTLAVFLDYKRHSWDTFRQHSPAHDNKDQFLVISLILPTRHSPWSHYGPLLFAKKRRTAKPMNLPTAK